MTSSTRLASASASDSSLNGTPAASSVAFTRSQRGVVADLPADGDDLVGVAGHDDDARGALVHPQIQRVVVGPEPSAKPSTSKANWRQRGRSVA